MDSSTYKRYHLHGCDSRQLLESYLSEESETVFGDDAVKFPIENLAQTFSDGCIKGDVLLDLSSSSMVHHLYSACGSFKDIIVLKASNRCIMELKRWLDARTGAFNWGHATKHHGKIQGLDTCDQLEAIEKQLRLAAQHIVKCDPEKENITHPIVLPPADCIISAWFLDLICKDQDDYIKNLRKFCMLLKPGKPLILIGVLGMTYYTVGKDKLCAFSYDEDFARKALALAGFVIDSCVVKKRTNESDLINYKALIYLVVHKK